jgi:hypothetical protein
VTRSALAGDLARLHSGAPGGWPAFAARTPGADRLRRSAGAVDRPDDSRADAAVARRA